MRVIHLAGATSFTDPDTGTTYEAGPDGVFELPEHVGTHYVTKHAGMFRRESDHEALIAAKKAEALNNPHNTAPTLKALLDRVTALESKIAAWEEFFGGDAPAGKTAPASERADKQAPGANNEGPHGQAPTEPDESEDDESDPEDEPETEEDTALRKPTPRKTATKRRG